MDTPATKDGILNIGAGQKPIEGAYNIDLNPSSTGVHVGDATNLSNVAANSQSKIIIQNPYGYDALNPEMARVLQPGGRVEISGGMSNKFFNRIYKMTDVDLMAAGYTVQSRSMINGAGIAYTTAGEPIKSNIMEIILIKN